MATIRPQNLEGTVTEKKKFKVTLHGDKEVFVFGDDFGTEDRLEITDDDKGRVALFADGMWISCILEQS